MVVDHLILQKESKSTISKCFLNEQLFMVQYEPWYADIVNYLVTSEISLEWSKHDNYRFFSLVKFFYYDGPYCFKYYSDQIFKRCVPGNEIISILCFYDDQVLGAF